MQSYGNFFEEEKLSPYGLFQIEKYGNISPTTCNDEDRESDELNNSELNYIYSTENPAQ